MSSPRSLAHKLTLASGTLLAATALGAFGSGAFASATPAQQTGSTGESRITQDLSITDSSEQTVCDVYGYYTPPAATRVTSTLFATRKTNLAM